VGNVLTATITGLTNGTTYTFKVAAANIVGTGAQSAASNAVTPIGFPGAPTIGTATAGNAQATVTWTAPASNGGSAITGYVVTPYIGTSAQSPTTVGNVLTATITGLTNGTTYTFKVAAANIVGTGAQSAASNAVTPTSIVFRSASFAQTSGATSLTIAKPAGVQAGDILIGTVAVRSAATITPPSGWTFIRRDANGTDLEQAAYFHVVTGTELATFAWTIPNAAAVGGIAAYVGVDVSVPVNVVEVSSGGTTSSSTNVVAPTLTTLTFGDLLVGAFTIASGASFSPPSGMVELGETALASGKNKVGVELTGAILGAAGATGPRTAVADKAAVGIGQLFALRPAGAPVQPTAPGASSGLTATRGVQSVSLSWTAPTSDGGSPITGYNVYRGTTAGGEGSTPVGMSTTTTFSDSGLTNGTTYYYIVRAVNAVGPGAPSNEASATPGAIATVPGAPTSLSATGGQGTVHLTWAAPDNGGSQITNYRVYRGTSSGNETLLTTVGNVISWNDTVAAGTYYYKVSAVNGVGEGPQSFEASATATAPPSQTVPSAPQNLAGAPASGRGVQLTWSAPASNGGSAITGYRVYRGTASGAETLLTTLGVVTTFKDTGTTRGGAYYYKVTAINAIGESPRSDEVTVTAK
jgi:fibronectin type 3 domain-containing protein